MPIITLPETGISLKEIEKMVILQALVRCRWVQKDTARLLLMSPRMLHYKIHTVHRIQPPPTVKWVMPPMLSGKKRGHVNSKLTQADVTVIRDDAEGIRGTTATKAKRIADRARGMFGPWQRVYAILTRETWNRT